MRVNPTFTGFEEFCTAGDKTEPSSGLKASGYLPLEMLPAQHFNWLLNRASKGVTETEQYVDTINKELNGVLTLAGISPSGGDSQLKDALSYLYGYDYIIDSDASLAAIIDATSASYGRVLIKSGTWNYTKTASKAILWDLGVTGTYRIDAEPGAVLNFDSTNGTTVLIGRASWSDLWANLEATSINNLTIKYSTSGGYAMTGFSYLSGLKNCHYIYRSTNSVSPTVNWFGFSNCYNLVGCTVNALKLPTSASTGWLYSFSGCSQLSNCSVLAKDNEETSYTHAPMNGFSSCTDLSNCYVFASQATYSRFSYAFELCKRLSNCYASGRGDNFSVSVFKQCENMNNCFVQLSSSLSVDLSVFSECKKLSDCRADSSISSIGYTLTGFNTCSNLGCCEFTHSGTSSTAVITGFKNCVLGLSSCRASIVLSGSAEGLYGYYSCQNLAACEAAITVGATGGSQTHIGFGTCSMLSSCVSAVGGRSTAAAVGFNSCSNIIGCKGGATNGGTGTGHGFSSCSQCQQNAPGIASKTATQIGSYADTSTNAYAYTAAGGYNRV